MRDQLDSARLGQEGSKQSVIHCTCKPSQIQKTNLERLHTNTRTDMILFVLLLSGNERSPRLSGLAQKAPSKLSSAVHANQVQFKKTNLPRLQTHKPRRLNMQGQATKGRSLTREIIPLSSTSASS